MTENLDTPESAQSVDSQPKLVGRDSYRRNLPCFCGSGAKYKKCCGSPEAKRARDEEAREAQARRNRERLDYLIREEKRASRALQKFATSCGLILSSNAKDKR